MDKNRNQRQPDPNKKGGSPNQENSGRRKPLNEPTAQQNKGNKSNQPQDSPTEKNEPAGEWRRPLTNQDEQRKTTNVQNNDNALSEEETEGEQHHERIKPYKNVGDDSEEVEKKTPSM